MLADAATDSRKRILPADGVEGHRVITIHHLAHERLNVDMQRAGVDTLRILAIEATKHLDANLGVREPEGDFAPG